MTGVVWHKVWRDLARNKARTILAVLSIAVGVFALGLAFGASGVIPARMAEAQRATLPAHVTFWGGPFDPDTVDAVRREPGVADAEGEIVARFRWKLEGETQWRDAGLVARDDYEAQRMGLLRRLDGRWPAERALGVERLSSHYFDLPPGTAVMVEFGKRGRRLPIEGVVRAHVVDPPQWGGDAMFFATPETVAWLTGQGEDFNQLHVRLESFSQEAAGEAARRIERRLERMGLSVGGYSITDPDVHWLQDMVDATLIVLVVLGVLSLALSAFLIINTMNALVAQQVWQIGVMKAIGATFGRVARIYLATALIYGLLALLLAVPLGVASAHLMSVWLLDLFNIEVGAFQIEPAAVGIQVAVGVAVPLLAAGVPVAGGARITTRQAISTHGLGSGFGRGWLDRLMGRVRCLPRPMALSLRNTFRRKARVALTLLTLTLSGVMFMMVMSVGDSFDSTVESTFDQLGHDIRLDLERPYHVSRLIQVAERVPGVIQAEVWAYRGATLSLASGEEHGVALWGVPPGSAMFDPRILGGRKLRPGDGKAVLVNHRLAADEGIGVGDELTLTIEGQESGWTVVGLVVSVSAIQDDFFVPLDALAREVGAVNRGTQVMVVSEADDIDAHQRLVAALRAAFSARRIEVTGSWNASQGREESRATFGTLTYLLLAMAILVAAVGSIGLMGTMSINVVERAREIGVMRAVGATSAAIAGIFVGEGVLLGVLSWLLAVPLSYPGARLFSDVIGDAVINFPLDFVYSTSAVILWLLIVSVLSALASLWPALRATRVSVREALVYE